MYRLPSGHLFETNICQAANLVAAIARYLSNERVRNLPRGCRTALSGSCCPRSGSDFGDSAPRYCPRAFSGGFAFSRPRPPASVHRASSSRASSARSRFSPFVLSCRLMADRPCLQRGIARKLKLTFVVSARLRRTRDRSKTERRYLECTPEID